MYCGYNGPNFRQRLLGLARSSTTITVIVDQTTYHGRVISVDFDNFEMVLTAGAAGIPAGSIVNFSFARLDAISVP